MSSNIERIFKYILSSKKMQCINSYKRRKTYFIEVLMKKDAIRKNLAMDLASFQFVNEIEKIGFNLDSFDGIDLRHFTIFSSGLETGCRASMRKRLHRLKLEEEKFHSIQNVTGISRFVHSVTF